MGDLKSSARRSKLDGRPGEASGLCGRGVVRVGVTPKDRFGNFLGPGYGSVVVAKLKSAGRLDPQPADRDQSGTYVFTVTDVPPGQTPDIDVVVDGVRIGSKLSPVVKPGG